ncbi:MAG TPA: MEDS domain-containing protein [Mycobacterium sp.]|nr:MEDS domain-containing protein [Mycobacterium sp.]
MRRRGTRVELVWMRPHDHIGWVFSNPDKFVEVAEPFLKEGLERGERLVFVAANPAENAYARLAGSFAPADLQVASIAEVYGASGIVDAAAQHAIFAAALRQALADGYTGIRVAADNTTLVQSAEQLTAWMHWELVADRFMSQNRVIGLCGFDRTAVNVDTLRHLVTLHPISSAADPVPQFRLFVDTDGLCLEGDVDDFAIGHLQRALDVLPPGTPAVVDLTRARPRDGAVKTELTQLAYAGVLITY